MSRSLRYGIVDGRIPTRSLESHVTDHCNLRCQQCCSLSPYLKPWYLDPDDLMRDLELAKRVLRPNYFKLVGGEPLLHPRLLDLLRVGRESGVAPILSVTTNGQLLHRMSELFWERLDHMTLSLYPSRPLPEGQMDLIERQTRRHGVTLNVKRQDEFQEMTLDKARSEQETTRQIFTECWLRDRCHMVRDRRFYLCTRPPHLDSYFHASGEFSRQDGISLEESPSLAEELLAYLEREEPLNSCHFCLGGSGRLFPHRQLEPNELRARALESP